jgi:hypothetical protein
MLDSIKLDITEMVVRAWARLKRKAQISIDFSRNTIIYLTQLLVRHRRKTKWLAINSLPRFLSVFAQLSVLGVLCAHRASEHTYVRNSHLTEAKRTSVPANPFQAFLRFHTNIIDVQHICGRIICAASEVSNNQLYIYTFLLTSLWFELAVTFKLTSLSSITPPFNYYL